MLFLDMLVPDAPGSLNALVTFSGNTTSCFTTLKQAQVIQNCTYFTVFIFAFYYYSQTCGSPALYVSRVHNIMVVKEVILRTARRILY
jgi:hypothetical protein